MFSSTARYLTDQINIQMHKQTIQLLKQEIKILTFLVIKLYFFIFKFSFNDFSRILAIQKWTYLNFELEEKNWLHKNNVRILSKSIFIKFRSIWIPPLDESGARNSSSYLYILHQSKSKSRHLFIAFCKI